MNSSVDSSLLLLDPTVPRTVRIFERRAGLRQAHGGALTTTPADDVKTAHSQHPPGIEEQQTLAAVMANRTAPSRKRVETMLQARELPKSGAPANPGGGVWTWGAGAKGQLGLGPHIAAGPARQSQVRLFDTEPCMVPKRCLSCL